MSPSIPAYAQPAFLEYVSAHAAKGDEDAERLMARVAKGKHIPKPPLPDSKGTRRVAHRTSTADLRSQVAERSGGKCEVSGIELGAAWELHHLSGGGHRRSRQALGNCLAVSWEVHRLIHRGDLATLRSVLEACIRLGMPEGVKAASRRIEKIHEARRVPSVPVVVKVSL
jgi:hypothetical protein